MLGILQKIISKPTIPVIHLNGPILQNSGYKMQQALDKINPNTAKALAIVVNSPGGLPVQSHIICSKIKNYAKHYNLPIYTFAEDIAASGGYFVLCIGDRVYVDSSSLVGSIGVIGNWMGVSWWLKKYNIENRKFTSNPKSLAYNLDPFDEYNPDAVKDVMDSLQTVHKNFINHVENYRKTKLNQNELEKIYSAQVFTGNDAIKLGLADSIGNYQIELQKLHPGCRLVNVSIKTKLQELKESFMNASEFNIKESLDIKDIMTRIEQQKQ